MGAVIVVDGDNANAGTTDSTGWTSIPVGPGPWLVRIYVPGISLDGGTAYFVVSYDGVVAQPFMAWLPLPSTAPTASPTPEPPAAVFLGLSRTGEPNYRVEYKYSGGGGGHGVSNIFSCNPLVPNYSVYGYALEVGLPVRFAAIERDCTNSISAAAFVPVLTPYPGSQTITAASSSAGIQIQDVTVNIAGHAPWPTPGWLRYETGDSDHWWLGGENLGSSTLTAQTLQVVHPDWATRHRFRLEVNRSIGGEIATYSGYRTSGTLPAVASFSLPPDPRIDPIPSNGSPGFTAHFDTTINPTDGMLEFVQSHATGLFWWVHIFHCGDCQGPRNFSVPSPPPAMPDHRPVAASTASLRVYAIERDITDIRPYWQTDPSVQLDLNNRVGMSRNIVW